MLGKTRRPELRAVFHDYIKRIGRSCPIEVNEVRDGEAAIKRLDSDRAATAVLLDAGGKPQDSETLARWLGEQRDGGRMAHVRSQPCGLRPASARGQ